MNGQATRDFALQIDREWAELQGGIRNAVIQIAVEGLAGVTEKSPVDVGTFRANWLVSVGTPDDSTTTSLAGFAGQSAGALAAYAAADGYPTIYLSNNLPYALRLENGWSAQAPSGVLALTVAELSALWERTQL